jgi:ATP-dependent Clp protease ATP-binding subunit ClpA
VTLEHLLFALTANVEALRLLLACACDIPRLHGMLITHFDGKHENLGPGAKPVHSAPVQRVLQRALIHVQSSGSDVITGADVVIALFAEGTSAATRFLHEQEITRYDAVNFLAHGISKNSPM